MPPSDMSPDETDPLYDSGHSEQNTPMTVTAYVADEELTEPSISGNFEFVEVPRVGDRVAITLDDEIHVREVIGCAHKTGHEDGPEVLIRVEAPEDEENTVLRTVTGSPDHA